MITTRVDGGYLESAVSADDRDRAGLWWQDMPNGFYSGFLCHLACGTQSNLLPFGSEGIEASFPEVRWQAVQICPFTP